MATKKEFEPAGEKRQDALSHSSSEARFVRSVASLFLQARKSKKRLRVKVSEQHTHCTHSTHFLVDHAEEHSFSAR